jgi:hypothetical protein
MQSWKKRHMTFLPDSAFVEFLPYNPQDVSSQRKGQTVLINQIEVNRLYEVILSQFHGMPLMRYHTGDVIRVTSIGDHASRTAAV